MKILAFDVSTKNTGWSAISVDINNGEYVINNFEYGNIQPAMSMGQCMGMFFFANRVKEIIDRIEPDEVVAEEVVSVFSNGFNTSRLLSKYGGILINAAFAKTQKEVFLYEPSTWRKAMGLSGKCHKTDTLLEIVKRLKLIDSELHLKYSNSIKEIYDEMDIAIKLVKDENLEKELKLKQEYKKDPEYKNMLKELKLENSNKLKKTNKDLKKIFDKKMIEVGTSIYSKSGVNFDSADSFGLLFAILSELIKKNKGKS